MGLMILESFLTGNRILGSCVMNDLAGGGTSFYDGGVAPATTRRTSAYVEEKGPTNLSTCNVVEG